ncbi:MAG: tetratricopeptide repeat protein [Candidatus Eiseniibacteriota bacterium]
MGERARQEADLPLEEIVAKDPTSALYLELATRLVERGRLDEAIQLCEEHRTRPGHGVGDHIVLGRAYLADGRLNEALAELEAALALDRENVVALKALAGILSHQGDHDRAAGYYRAVCRIDPGDLESQSALHQITSGEFPEVRPADVVVGQGELSWQPVRLPREEEHLPELGLGLRTIEQFDPPPPPIPYTAKVQDFQEVKLERAPKWVDEGETASTIMKGRESMSPAAPPFQERAVVPPFQERAAAASPPSPASIPSTEVSEGAAGPGAAAPGPPKQANRSAFEQWVRRLGGKEI